MLCPRCNLDLDALGVGRGQAHGCPTCRGVWLDDEALSALMNERAEALAAGAPRFRPEHDEQRLLQCPVCSLLMKKVERYYVQTDGCQRHGVWFDQGELGFAARGVLEERARQAAEAAAAAEVVSPGERWARNQERSAAMLRELQPEPASEPVSLFDDDSEY